MAADVYEYVIRRSTSSHTPLTVLVELTHACNVDCEHCYLDSQPDSKIGALSTDEWKRVFRELRAAGTLFLTMSGGEVFVRKDWFELATYARELGLALRFFSNGTLIDERNADRIASLRPLGVEITLLGGIPATHDAITRRRGAFDKTIAGIKRLRARGISVLMKCVVMDKNADELALIRGIAEEHGCALKFDAEISPKDDGSRVPKALAPDDSRALAAERFIVDYEGPDEASPREDRVPYAPCAAGQRVCQIGPTGDVFPCTQWTEPVGSLRRETFGEIWTGSATLKQIRSATIAEFTSCAECALLDVCGPCMAMSVLERGVIDGPSPTKCAAAELRAKALGLPGRSAWFEKIESEAAKLHSESRQRVRLPLVG